MKAQLFDNNGSKTKEINLPAQFEEQYRPDLIKKAVLTITANNRQPYGSNTRAGMRQKGKLSRRRRDYKTGYGRGISHVPRKVLNHRGTQFYFVGAEVPQNVGGRRAHPPKADKDWTRKINMTEKRKAIRSALHATTQKTLVNARGHRTEIAPYVLDTKIETIAKTQELITLLEKIGLGKELERINVRKIQAGKAKMRGRKYKHRTGPLFIVSEACKLVDAAKNIPGVDVVNVRNLNALDLAPGTHAGRLCIWSEKALQLLEKEQLFMKVKK